MKLDKFFQILKKILFWLYFFSPFLIWIFIYLQGETYLVLIRKESFNNSVVIFNSFLWQLIIFLIFIQVLNMVFYILLKNDIFVKINVVFIFFNLIFALKVLFFNFY